MAPTKYRTLRLTQPFMHGADVARVQRMLNQATDVPVSLLADGEYGPGTASAEAAWKYRMGFPAEAVSTGMGPYAQQLMFRGREPLPLDYAARRLVRMRAGWKPGWGVAKVQDGVGSRALQYGAQFVGLTENPAGSNKVPRLQAVGHQLGAGPDEMGYAWCAYFFFLCSLAVGGRAAIEGLREGKWNCLYTPTILEQATSAQRGLMIVGTSQVKPGDGVLLNFTGGDPRVDHIERVITPPPPGGGSFHSRGGNTSSDNSGSQSNGGGVFDRTRDTSIVRAFFREVA